MNLCLICSRSFKRKVGRPKKENVGNKKDIKRVKLLINYLLDNSANSFGNLKEEIFKNSEGGGVKDGFSLCVECEPFADKLLELQLELEKVQMEIINQLKIVREVVAEGVEENNKLRKGGSGLLRILKTFQDAVYERGKDSVTIPFVYLERVGVMQRTTGLHETDENVVKIEPEDEQLDYDHLENLSSLESRLVIPEINLPYNLEESSLPEMEVKTEHMETTRSQRSSAILARSRVTISQSKRLQKQAEREAMSRVKLNGVRKPNRKRTSAAAKFANKRQTSKQTGGKKPKRYPCLYRCSCCPFSCKSNCRFEEHLHEHDDKDDKCFQCELCNFATSSQEHFNFHKGRHKGLYKLNCDICLEKFSAYDLKDHMISHGAADNLIPCPKCCQYSSSLENYLVHLKVHTGSHAVTCHICQKQQKHRKELAKHLHTVHGLIKEISCDFEGCGAKYLLRDSLETHKIIHTNQFQCEKCLKCFSNQRDSETHKLRVHSKLKLFKCNQCPAEFSGYDTLQKHLILEHGAPKFKCDVCGKEYNTNGGLRYHRIMEHDKIRQNCQICNEKFGTKYKLRMHMEAKHSQGENYVCEECGKSLDSQDAYRKHRKIHGEKKYKCSFCPKAFAVPKYLTDHERTHTGERPYVCEFCGRAFNQQGAHGVHQKACKNNSTL